MRTGRSATKCVTNRTQSRLERSNEGHLCFPAGHVRSRYPVGVSLIPLVYQLADTKGKPFGGTVNLEHLKPFFALKKFGMRQRHLPVCASSRSAGLRTHAKTSMATRCVSARNIPRSLPKGKQSVLHLAVFLDGEGVASFPFFSRGSLEDPFSPFFCRGESAALWSGRKGEFGV